MTRSRLVLLALAGLASPALAQPKVAIAAAASSSLTDCRYTDVQAMLIASGQFSSVDILNVVSGALPTLATLQTYDAVITWSNVNYINGDDMGNLLADYVDSGGGVVVAVFANATTTSNRWLGGRWQNDYEVILDQSGTSSGSASLGLVSNPLHPIMDGVVTFLGGTSSFRPAATVLTVGSTEIAQWSDGKTLVAVGSNPKRVDLGFYPPSSTCSSSFWTAGTDGNRLLANALAFVAGSSCYPDCEEDGDLDVFDFLCFQGAYASQTTYADCEGDGDWDVFDFLCFQGKFANGCD